MIWSISLIIIFIILISFSVKALKVLIKQEAQKMLTEQEAQSTPNTDNSVEEQSDSSDIGENDNVVEPAEGDDEEIYPDLAKNPWVGDRNYSLLMSLCYLYYYFFVNFTDKINQAKYANALLEVGKTIRARTRCSKREVVDSLNLAQNWYNEDREAWLKNKKKFENPIGFIITTINNDIGYMDKCRIHDDFKRIAIADGNHSDAEKEFITRLGESWGLH